MPRIFFRFHARIILYEHLAHPGGRIGCSALSSFTFLKQPGHRKIVTNWKFAWRAASRFVAGETLDDAIRVIKLLNQKGINATLDHLGEHTTDLESARRAAQEILQVLDAIQSSGVRANVSIKLTQIGLSLDEGVCRENLQMILQKASGNEQFRPYRYGRFSLG